MWVGGGGGGISGADQEGGHTYARLHCQPFSRAQLLELWYGVLEALL